MLAELGAGPTGIDQDELQHVLESAPREWCHSERSPGGDGQGVVQLDRHAKRQLRVPSVPYFKFNVDGVEVEADANSLESKVNEILRIID